MLASLQRRTAGMHDDKDPIDDEFTPEELAAFAEADRELREIRMFAIVQANHVHRDGDMRGVDMIARAQAIFDFVMGDEPEAERPKAN